MTTTRELPSLVIFDLAGTTIRDSANVAAVFCASLAEYSITPTEGEIKRWRGAAKRAAIRHLSGSTSNDRIEQIYHTFQNNLINAFLAGGVEPFPGIESAFAALRNDAIRIALTTGFDRTVTDTILARLRWSDVVTTIVTADDVHEGRPAPDLIYEAMKRSGVLNPEQVVNVGDTINDLESATAAGVGSNIGVLTGAHSRADLESVQHTAILDGAADVPVWISGHRTAPPARR